MVEGPPGSPSQSSNTADGEGDNNGPRSGWGGAFWGQGGQGGAHGQPGQPGMPGPAHGFWYGWGGIGGQGAPGAPGGGGGGGGQGGAPIRCVTVNPMTLTRDNSYP